VAVRVVTPEWSDSRICIAASWHQILKRRVSRKHKNTDLIVFDFEAMLDELRETGTLDSESLALLEDQSQGTAAEVLLLEAVSGLRAS
jgi:hypothetical protein